MSAEWVVGTDGKKVHYSRDQKGNIHWSANATADIKRAGNAMLRTNTGTLRLDKMPSSKTETHFEIDPSAKVRHFDDPKTGVPMVDNTFGETIPKSAEIIKGQDGKENVFLPEVTMKIYEGTITSKAGKSCLTDG